MRMLCCCLLTPPPQNGCKRWKQGTISGLRVGDRGTAGGFQRGSAAGDHDLRHVKNNPEKVFWAITAGVCRREIPNTTLALTQGADPRGDGLDLANDNANPREAVQMLSRSEYVGLPISEVDRQFHDRLFRVRERRVRPAPDFKTSSSATMATYHLTLTLSGI